MKKWALGFVVLILAAVLSVSFYLYNFGGLKQYMRAITLINKMPEEYKEIAKNELRDKDKSGGERGILAGSWIGRVWIWNAHGLKSFAVDEFTIYSLFNGCSDEVRAKLNKGINGITRTMVTSFSDWKNSVNAGDYVTVYIAKPENGGIEGNIREIYDYNFWLFLNNGIDIQCAK